MKKNADGSSHRSSTYGAPMQGGKAQPLVSSSLPAAAVAAVVPTILEGQVSRRNWSAGAALWRERSPFEKNLRARVSNSPLKTTGLQS